VEIHSDSTNLEKVRKFQFSFDRVELKNNNKPREENVQAC